MNPIASTPEPPYFAVIFTSLKTKVDEEQYQQTAARMFELASSQPGYLGMEHVGDSSGAAITISYWSSLESIESWRRHGEHLDAQANGRLKWYEHYALRVCRVERASVFSHAASTFYHRTAISMSHSSFSGRPLQDWITDLRENLSSDERYRALLAVQSLGSPSEQLECCRLALGDMDSGIRAQAAKKLRDLRSAVETLSATDQSTVAAELNDRLRDDDPDVRFEAARALGQLDPTNQAALDLLLALFDDEGTLPLTLSVVVTALGERADLKPETLLSRFQKLLGHPQAEVRENVSAVVCKWGTAAAPLVVELLQALEDDEPIVRENAAIALGGASQASDEVLVALRQAASDEDEGVALAANASLERLRA